MRKVKPRWVKHDCGYWGYEIGLIQYWLRDPFGRLNGYFEHLHQARKAMQKTNGLTIDVMRCTNGFAWETIEVITV